MLCPQLASAKYIDTWIKFIIIIIIKPLTAQGCSHRLIEPSNHGTINEKSQIAQEYDADARQQIHRHNFPEAQISNLSLVLFFNF